MLSTLKRSYWVIVAAISVVVSLLFIPVAFASNEKNDTSALGLSDESYSTVDDSFLGPVFKAEDMRSTASVITATPGWELLGTCEWRIDDAGCLTLRPVQGLTEGYIEVEDANGDRSNFPWIGMIKYTNVYDSRTAYAEIGQKIKDFKVTGKVKAKGSMYGMFMACKNLENFVFPSNLDTSEVVSATAMFWNCGKLKTIDLSKLNTSKIQSMKFMFNYCGALTGLDLRSFDTRSCENMYGMFWDCTSLEKVDLSSFNTSNVDNICFMFSGCSKLGTLDLHTFDTSKVWAARNTFAYCSSLKNLDLSNFKTRSLEVMEGMFAYCSSIEELDLSSFDTSNVEYMSRWQIPDPDLYIPGGLFVGCSSLKKVDLTSFDTSKVAEFDCMFYECSSLKSLDLSSFDTTGFKGDVSKLEMFDKALAWISIGDKFTLQIGLPDKVWYNLKGEPFSRETIPVGVAGIYQNGGGIDEDGRGPFISDSSLNVVVGCDPIQLSVENVEPGTVIRWTSSDPSVATVDSTGKVYIYSTGSVIVSAVADHDIDDCFIMVSAKALFTTDDSDLSGHLAIWDSDTARKLDGNYLKIKKSDMAQNTTLRRNLLNSIDPGSELLEILDIDIVDADGNAVAWSDPDHVVTVQFGDNYLSEYMDDSIYMGIHYIKSSNEFEHSQGYWYRGVPELSFDVNHFSTYAITATPIVDDSLMRNNVNATGDPSTNKLAQTGDMLGFGAFAIIELIMFAVGITLIARSQTLRSKER